MKKVFIPLIIIVILAVVGLSIYWWWQVRETTNKNENENANVAIEYDFIPTPTGNINVNQSTTYKSVGFEIETAQELQEFASKTAEEGKKYVVLYLKHLTDAKPADVTDWIDTDAKLVTGEKQVGVYGSKLLSSDGNPYDRGYLWFIVDSTDSDFDLVFGSGDDKQTIDLGF